MRAIIQDRYGPPHEVLRLAEVEKPDIEANEVLVKVKAASVHADVWHTVTGFPHVMRLMGAGVSRPKNPIPGIDMAGVVEAVGSDVTRFQVGDAVFGETHLGLQWMNGGAYAEYVAVPADILAVKPDNVTFDQAASVPTSGIIALENLYSVGMPGPGQQVLVNGAGGGVGSIALQLAKAHGATVTAVDSADKLEMLRFLGADFLIDYTAEDFVKGSQQYDLIFDVASNLRFSECKRVLTPSGKYVVIGHDHYGTQGRSLFGSIPKMLRLMVQTPFTDHLPKAGFSMPAKHDLMETLSQALADGQITPVIDRTFPLEETAAAINYLTTGQACGRIIVTP